MSLLVRNVNQFKHDTCTSSHIIVTSTSDFAKISSHEKYRKLLHINACVCVCAPFKRYTNTKMAQAAAVLFCTLHLITELVKIQSNQFYR